jgi:phytoene synthase
MSRERTRTAGGLDYILRHMGLNRAQIASAPPAHDGLWSGYAPWAEAVLSCRREFVSVARSFWLIPEIITPAARDDVALLYCFCRRLDDAVDEAPDVPTARAALARWRDELAGRAPPRPLIAAFLAGIPRNGLPLECAGDLLDGMESDLSEVRIADDGELLRYAYRVSSSVGLMLAPLLGASGRDAEQRVVDLGLALQLSNILLGVVGDARRGRVYLPATRLASEGLQHADVLRKPADGLLLPVLQGVAALADEYYRSAALGAALVPLRYRHGVLLMARLYGELGWRAARGEAPRDVPARLPFFAKVLRLLELFLLAWHPRVAGFVPPPPHDAALHRAIAGWRGAHA